MLHAATSIYNELVVVYKFLRKVLMGKIFEHIQ
jgi:hypothetical protein